MISTNAIASEFMNPDVDYSMREAARYATVQGALGRGDIAFDVTSSTMRAKFPVLASVETSEIERLMRSLIVEEIDKRPRTAVVFDERRRVVRTVEIPAEKTSEQTLDAVKDAMKAVILSEGEERAVFEIFLMPRGTYSSNPMLVHKRGVPFGMAEVSVGGEVTGWFGIERDVDIEYRPEPQLALGSRAYKSDGELSSGRDIARQLDWLEAQLCLFRDFAPRDPSQFIYQPEVGSVETGKQANQRQVDEISVRIFSLAAKLFDRHPSWLTENERSGGASAPRSIQPTIVS